MSVSSEDTVINDSWKVELEIALLEDSDFTRIRSICQNRPVPEHLRKDIWRACLRPEGQTASMSQFEEIYDLSNQTELHTDCETYAKRVIDRLTLENTENKQSQKAVDTISTHEDEELAKRIAPPARPISNIPSLTILASDFEAVLTHFARTYDQDYQCDNGWLPILSTLYRALKPPDRAELYACFTSVHHRFVAAGYDSDNRACVVLRLLVQYHEPKLCSLLDSHKIGAEDYASIWLSSLFANIVDSDCILSLWDTIFLVSDPLFSLFMSFVFLLNAKSTLFSNEEEDEEGQGDGGMENGDRAVLSTYKDGTTLDEGGKKRDNILSRAEVLRLLCDLPRPIQPDDLTSLVELAQIFSDQTPASFRTHYLPLLFGNSQPEAGAHLLAGALCMPVSVDEVLEAQEMSATAAAGTGGLSGVRGSPAGSLAGSAGGVAAGNGVRFLLVDCRPASQYNAGHLATAFYLNSELTLSNPPEFRTTAEALMQSQRRAIAAGSRAAGEHIAFLSSGRVEEDTVANMLVAHFLRQNIKYVSLVVGGYAALHDALGPLGAAAAASLVSHEPADCLVCQRLSPPRHPAAGRQPLASQQKHPQQQHYQTLTSGVNTVSIPVPSATAAVNAVDNLLSKFSSALFKPRPNRQETAVATNATSGTTLTVDQVRLRESGPGGAGSNGQTSRPVESSGGGGGGVGSSSATSAASGSISYRNTSAVFSIDDDFDADEEEEGLSPSTEKTLAAPLANGSTKMTVTRGDGDGHETRPLGDSPVRSDGLDTCIEGDLIDTSCWSRRREVRGVFLCRFLGRNGQLADAGFLVLAERHMLVLRMERRLDAGRVVASIGSLFSALTAGVGGAAGHQGASTAVTGHESAGRRAVVDRCVPLLQISRITSNRRLPELITFSYGGFADCSSDELDAVMNSGTEQNVARLRDRIYLKDAGSAVKMIKLAVYQASNETADEKDLS